MTCFATGLDSRNVCATSATRVEVSAPSPRSDTFVLLTRTTTLCLPRLYSNSHETFCYVQEAVLFAPSKTKMRLAGPGIVQRHLYGRQDDSYAMRRRRLAARGRL